MSVLILLEIWLTGPQMCTDIQQAIISFQIIPQPEKKKKNPLISFQMLNKTFVIQTKIAIWWQPAVTGFDSQTVIMCVNSLVSSAPVSPNEFAALSMTWTDIWVSYKFCF